MFMLHGVSSTACEPVASVWQGRDRRRTLQLGLAAVWLLDAILQMQPFMFTRGFGELISGTAQGNPGVIFHSVSWSGSEISAHAVAANSVFLAIQLLLALGIAWRPTVRLALAASVVWSVGVWWIGEGLGGILTSSASAVSGAPGAVVLYGFLAILVWPVREDADRVDGSAWSVAGERLGRVPAAVAWFVLWGSLAYFELQSAIRDPSDVSGAVVAMEAGEPRWLTSVDSGTVSLLTRHTLGVSIPITVLLAAIAVAGFAPQRIARWSVAAAVVFAAVIWVAAEDFGGILTGTATDPNTGPLLALVAIAYWPARQPRVRLTAKETGMRSMVAVTSNRHLPAASVS